MVAKASLMVNDCSSPEAAKPLPTKELVISGLSFFIRLLRASTLGNRQLSISVSELLRLIIVSSGLSTNFWGSALSQTASCCLRNTGGATQKIRALGTEYEREN
jgi:hypothetical protein